MKAKEHAAVYGYGCREGYHADAYHHRGGEDKAHDKELAGVGAVRQAAHDEFAEGVCYGYSGHCHAGALLVEQTFGDHAGGCEREVLAYEIVGGVADESAQKYTQAQTAVFGIDAVGRNTLRRCGRIEKFHHVGLVFGCRCKDNEKIGLMAAGALRGGAFHPATANLCPAERYFLMNML